MTATERSVKKEIKQLVDELTLEEAQDLLDTLNLRFEGGPLTEEERQAVEEADAEYARGETVSLEDVKRELDQ